MIPVSLLSSEIIAPYGAVAVLEAGLMLPVMEQFYTIQGEGYNTGRAARMTPALVEYVKQHPRWQVSLQTHKYLDIP